MTLMVQSETQLKSRQIVFEQYGIGVAVANNPTGAFKKMPQPFLKSTEE